MPDAAWMIQNEGVVRLTIFLALIVAFAGLEMLRPAVSGGAGRMRRWPANIGLGVVSAIVMRLLLPGAVVLAAIFAQMRGWGALNQVDAPWWLETALALTLLDLAIYAQHVAMHKFPWLWLLHRVHHADPGVDVTTAIRFHPVEIVVSSVYKISLVVALGVDPMAVIAYEVMLNALAIFNHANLRLPAWADAALRPLIVTPDMHRVHHSERPEETDSNYGNTLAVWDRVFATYRPEPKLPLVLGLRETPGDTPMDLGWCLISPVRDPWR